MSIVYKLTAVGWSVFGKQNAISKRYVKMRLSVDSVPQNITLIQVIESAKNIIVLDDHQATIRVLLNVQISTTNGFIIQR